MRTRIALAAIVPVAIVGTTGLVQAAPQPAQATSVRSAAFPAPSSASGTPPSTGLSLTITPVATADWVPTHRTLAHASTSSLPFSRSVWSTVTLDAATPTAATAPAITPPAIAPPAIAPPATTPPATPAGPVDTVTPAQRAAWERVAMCEEGGNWQADGSRFSGGLGITRTNWIANGGREFAPEGAEATEDQQIMVAERIQYSPPDQYGCHGW